MQKKVILFLLVACFYLPTEGAIIYVKSDAQGANDGTSWIDAFGSLTLALNQALAGDSIWVAQGVYKPGSSRSSTFLIPAGVHVFGGFTGLETKIDQRNSATNLTILDGDLNGNDAGGVFYTNATRLDNAYSVVTFDNSDNGLIDGFIIQNGNAEGSSPGPTRYGAGVYITGVYANDGIINVTVSNCVIQQCAAVYSCAVEARQYASTTGVPIEVLYKNLTVRYNYGFGSVFGGGANTMNNTVSYTVANSLIHNNVSTNAYLVGLFSQQGGSVTAHFVNNTIANNRLASAYSVIGIGNYTSTGFCAGYFYNNIFYNNGTNETFGQNPGLNHSISFLGFHNNLVQDASSTGSSVYLNNIQAVPLFTDTIVGDFSLEACSPGVNQGDTAFMNWGSQDISFAYTGREDIQGDTRFFADSVDMGAFETVFDTSIDVNGVRLTANIVGSGFSYQWYDCNTGLALPNETLHYLDVVSNGSYYVQISLNSCLTAKSDCIQVSNVGIDEIVQLDLSLYPNPTENSVWIDTEARIDRISLADIQGRIIGTYTGDQRMVSLEALSPGVYIILIESGATSTSYRIIKK